MLKLYVSYSQMALQISYSQSATGDHSLSSTVHRLFVHLSPKRLKLPKRYGRVWCTI